MNRPRWRRHLVVAFMAVFVLGQVTVPALGLYARAVDDGVSRPFSWQMFSKAPTNDE